MTVDSELLSLTANTIRGLAMDAVEKAGSGHPGMPMGMADAASVLWLEFLKFSPTDPEWRGRDRFVLSAGHGSMLLYSLLHLAGYDVTLDDLRRFRRLHSKSPGHPEYGETPGVETTTGPLGQGFGNGVGMALGARMEAARFHCPPAETRVFGIVSDGDLMEGISSEAASLAGHLRLANLVYLYDDNRITIDGSTGLAFREDVDRRFEGMGWKVLAADGHDFSSVRAALEEAVAESERPTLIRCRTHIGFGSPHKVDTAAAHGAPLGAEEVRLAKKQLGLPPEETFWVPDEVRAAFAARVADNERARAAWLEAIATWEREHPDRAAERRRFLARELPADLYEQLRRAVGEEAAATRKLSGKAIAKAVELSPSVVGGSADLTESNNTAIPGDPSVQAGRYEARYLHFGVREHAMGAILNGLALQGGYLPYGGTFLVFSDYMRPAVRLACLMKLPVGYVYSHDSLLLGEDGPTHQPVEQLAALRLIPGLHVFRPADGPEVAAAWTHRLRRREGPVAIALTRQKVEPLPRPEDFDFDVILRGGYVLEDAPDPVATVIATGAEVAPTLEAARALRARGLSLRVVSMPCVELFLAQDEAWRRRVLPEGIPVCAVEMGRPEIWCRFTGSLDRVIGVTTFGASAPAADLAQEFGFTAEALAEKLAAMPVREPA